MIAGPRNVRYVYSLITLPPLIKFDLTLRASNLREKIEEFNQARGVFRSSSDIIDRWLTLWVFEKGVIRPNEIFYIQDIPNLLTVTKDSEWLIFQYADSKMCHPPLIFISKLSGAVNTAHSECCGIDFSANRIVLDVLISSEL